MASVQEIFHQQERRKRWRGCCRALSCFGAQKGGKRIVPAFRIPEGNASATEQNRPQNTGSASYSTGIAPALLAPPSSPASFTNSALQSTAQSPRCFSSLSANSPEIPSMFATGPYAHETQLVSPPVCCSTFTTEPSTAPFTPPPELAHLTTPSSPDVPFARFLASSMDFNSTEKTGYVSSNALQATYALYPGSPASSLRSPISRRPGDCFSSSFREREFRQQWNPSAFPQNNNPSSGISRQDKTGGHVVSQESNFFCPATFAQFYLDNDAPYPLTGGRISVSKESDIYPSTGNGHQIRQTKVTKQEVEEPDDSYRASFGFSADDMINSNQYVKITDLIEESYPARPLSSDKHNPDDEMGVASLHERHKWETAEPNLASQKNYKPETDLDVGVVNCEEPRSCSAYEDHKLRSQPNNISGSSTPDEEDIFSKVPSYRTSKICHKGLSSSDAEIDYRRIRSLRKGKRACDIGRS